MLNFGKEKQELTHFVSSRNGSQSPEVVGGVVKLLLFSIPGWLWDLTFGAGRAAEREGLNRPARPYARTRVRVEKNHMITYTTHDNDIPKHRILRLARLFVPVLRRSKIWLRAWLP